MDNIAELEDTLKMLAGDRKRIAVFYENGKGWCVTDDMDVLSPKMSELAPEYRIICYKDWFRRTLAEAVQSLQKIHLLRAAAISDRFSRP